MSRYRLNPRAARTRRPAPGFAALCRQLTEGATEPWLAEGSQNVEQQALPQWDRPWHKKAKS